MNQIAKTLKTLAIIFVLTNLAKAQSSNIMIHDPVIIEAYNKYYMFSTGVGIASWESTDLENWTLMPQIFPQSPEWAKERVPLFDGNIWAPDIVHHNNTYYLYYSISSFKSNRSCIGVLSNKTLERKSPDFKWVDHGMVIESYPGRDLWNAIDPNIVFDENGTPWMSFGSFWAGLKLVKMNADLISLAEPQEWHTIASRPRSFELHANDPGDGAIEAPFIFKKGEYFYLFVSFDLCCRGENSDYNVRVGRSKSVTGPYLDRDGISMEQGGGTLIMNGGKKWYGVGHNAVATLRGTDFNVMHGYEKADNGHPKLIIQKVNWTEDGWPKLIEK
jgi:arabinan endo-1,5-alpha-L-arabinosidase